MCCKTVYQGITYRPGDLVPVKSAHKKGAGKWSGFARSESAKAIWSQSHDVELDIPAERFGEHNRSASKIAGTRVETECPLSAGRVIYALGNRKSGSVKILTREANDKEKARIGHNRVPVTGPSRF